MMLLLLSLVYAVSGTGSGSGPLRMEAIGAYCSGFDVDPAGLNGTGCSETTPFLYVDVSCGRWCGVVKIVGVCGGGIPTSLF